MKRIYKSCVAVLLLLAMLLSCVPALAAGSSRSLTTLQKAEALKTLGIFQGTNKGFELEKTLTREQAITLIVRLLGAEAEAKEKNPEHPFTDVLAWANPYVGYGYQNALVKGVSQTLFGYGKLVTEAQFLTMVLRLLQYEDDADFTWNKSAELAEKLGLPVVPANSGDYTRGNAVDVIWALLETKLKTGGKTLAQTLIEKGVFTEKAYREAAKMDETGNGGATTVWPTPTPNPGPAPDPKPDPDPDPKPDPDPDPDPDPEPTEQPVYVSPDGNSDGDGSKDAPFGSLEAVRDYLRGNRSTELPTTVYLRGGTYVLDKTFELTEADGGTEELPVTWRAYPGETVTITGSAGASFSAFEPVSDEMKAKLSSDAQEHVMVADVSALGLGTINVGLTQSNFCIDAPLFSLDGQHMSLTRYPNSNSTEDWMHVETVDPTQTTGTYPKIKLTDEAVLNWNHNVSDRIYFGYFSYGWALHGFRGTLDSETGIVTAADASHYGSSSGLKPMQIYNAYDSLDEPGEWYYDKTTGKLYIYPFANTTVDSTLRMTSGNFDLISVTGASYLNFEGLTITSSKKNGIVMDGVDHCVIDNCTLTDFEERAVSIDNATNSGIQNSEIAYTSVTAMYLDGGDFRTMTPGNNFISNCRIHDTNQYRTMNEGGIRLRGVQNTFSNNEVYNITDIALNFAVAGDAETSLDCVIENNSFHDVILNGKDMAAVYGGRDARCQGLIIRNNHFYNLGNNDASYPNFAGSAVYMDDGLSGVTITGNIFGPGASGDYIEAIKINCGHDHKITNNLFIDMPCALYAYIDNNFETRMTSDNGGYGIASSLREVWNNELYTARWPWMAEAAAGSKNFYIQNIVKDNIIIYTDAEPHSSTGGGNKWFSTNGQDDKLSGIDENLVILKGESDNRQLFADYANGNYALADSVLSQIPSFEQIDQSGIGLKNFPGNQKPAASGVSVSGTAEVGQTITAAYTFSDADGDAEGATVANYYISETRDELFYLNWKKVSDNMTSTEFTVTPICEGKWIRCKLTPVDSRGAQGTPVWSDPVLVAFTSTVDKTAFRALVDEAKAKVAAAAIGDEPGQWTQKEIDLITAAIADAEAVLAKDPISQYDFDLGVAAFQKAYTRFLNNQNAGTATDLIEIDALIEDQDNWTPYKDNKAGKPTFAGGKLMLNATSAYQTACYTGKAYTNKTFRFTYQQSGSGWGGFYFNMGNAEALPFGQTKGVLVVTKTTGTELQIRDGVNDAIQLNSDFVFESGKTYRVDFGVYDLNSTDVRFVLTVDGTAVFSHEMENQYLHTAEGHFGVLTAPNGIDLVLGSVGTKLVIDSLIDDEENWQTSNGSAAPKFIAGKMILDGSSHTQAGYVGEAYTNRVLHFTYKQELSDTVGSANKWGGLFFNTQSAGTIPWQNPSLLVCIKSNVIELQIRDGSSTTVLENKTNLIESGKTYRMTFGMYDVNSSDVRIVLTADDVTLFDETVTNPKLLGMQGYYGAIASGEGVHVEIGSLGNKINVATLVRDENNWTTLTKTAPTFSEKALSITSSDAGYELAAYTGEKFSGKVFNFKYKQVLPETAGKWGGFYFNLNDPVKMPWADKGVLVVIKEDQVELQIRGDKNYESVVASGEIFRSDMIYDVSFGIVAVDADDTRIFVTVDGKTLFDETVTDATLHGASGYFGTIACPGGVQVTLNDLSGNDKHYNKTTELPLDTLIADTANWTDFSWAGFKTAPTFGDGTVSIAGTTETAYALAGYSKQKYRNTEFQMKYTQTAANAANNYGAIIWSFAGKVTNLPWNSGGVMVSFEKGKTTLYAYGDAVNSPKVKTDLTLEDGKTYDISLSVCQIAANQLRVVFKVDGTVWFDETYTDSKLANTAGYFCIGAVKEASVTIGKTGKVMPTEPEEPTYTVVEVTEMLADTANWNLATWATPVPTFASGSITADSTSYSLGGYKTPVSNTVFHFKYKQTLHGDNGWGGFFLGFVTNNLWFNKGGIQAQFKKSESYLLCNAADKTDLGHPKSTELVLKDGQEYDVEFGIIDVDESTVKVILKVDGTAVFEKELTHEDFVGKQLYFGISAYNVQATIYVPKAEPAYTVVDVTEMLADTANWNLATWATPVPTFADGSITADSTSYSLGGYKTPVSNTVFRFKYKQTLHGDNGWGGFFLGFVTNNLWFNKGGIQAQFKKSESYLLCNAADKTDLGHPKSTELILKDGQEYDIEFGIIDVDESTVKVTLKVDGTAVFEKELTHEDFVGKQLYFGISAYNAQATISKPDAK